MANYQTGEKIGEKKFQYAEKVKAGKNVLITYVIIVP